jgi:integrase
MRTRKPRAGPLVAIIERRKAARPFEMNGVTRLSEYIFHRGGQPVGDFKKSWKTATAKSGVGNFLFHDLRRCAVRDLVRAGAPQSVAMSITGHKTISVFQRYDITADADMKAALEKTAKYRAG